MLRLLSCHLKDLLIVINLLRWPKRTPSNPNPGRSSSVALTLSSTMTSSPTSWCSRRPERAQPQPWPSRNPSRSQKSQKASKATKNSNSGSPSETPTPSTSDSRTTTTRSTTTMECTRTTGTASTGMQVLRVLANSVGITTRLVSRSRRASGLLITGFQSNLWILLLPFTTKPLTLTTSSTWAL